MIQLLHLRTYEKNGKPEIFDKFIREGFGAESISDLFLNLETYLDQIPKADQWNCFYTLAQCGNNKREFQSQHVMAFDIDGIDNALLEKYIDVVCETLALKKEEIGIVASGNGIHFLVGLKTPIVDKHYFKNNRDHYKALCIALQDAILRAGLPLAKGDKSVDPSVFDHRRIFRLPGTINRKPGKEDRVARLVNRTIIPIDFDLTLASGIPTVKKDEQIDPAYFKKFPKTDNTEIFKQCSFMKEAKDHPAKMSEPQWYAALSITARMTNGHEISHNISMGHPGYRQDVTDVKIEQAVNASGPRKCKSIAQIWSGCRSCPFYKQDSSPIMIRAADAIKTETTGFHDVIFDPETQRPIKFIPNFSDLRKFFERHHIYKSHDKLVWAWHKTHFKEMTNEEIKSFAQRHFDPYAKGGMRAEFLDLVQCTNLVNQEEWNASTFGKINLANGVLRLDSMALEPHTPENGFKYVLPYGYDPSAKAPRFEQFLQDVCQGNQEHINTLLEFGGYAISGARCKYHKALVLDGVGSNGKSTFIDTLKALVGNGSFSSLAFKDLDNTERRSALDGVLFNITEETPTKLYDTTSFKNLISGGSIPLRKLYKNAYTIENKAKLIFSANEMPASSDNSRGFYRRLLIIPFNATFSDAKGNKDTDLFDKLKEELPGILNLFLEGYRRLEQNKKFSKSEENDAEVMEYRKANDPVLTWFFENVVKTDDMKKFTPVSDLYMNFAEWCESNGFDPRVRNAISLSLHLKTVLPDVMARKDRERVDGKQVRILRGITLLGAM